MTQPADPNLVGLLSFGMCVLGFVLALALIVLASVNRCVRRLLPKPHSRGAYWIGLVIIMPLTLIAMLFTAKAIQVIAVICSYDLDAYLTGLRVANKHGLLTDGSYLGLFWSAALGAWLLPIWLTFTIPLAQWHCHYRARIRQRIR